MLENLDAAIRYAAEVHSGQFRDGEDPLPYIVHPIEVLSNLRNVGKVTDEQMLVAAALHDTIEETGTSAEEIEQRFGAHVSRLVVELTRREPTEEERRGLTKDQVWKLRSDWMLEEIRNMSSQAQQIKLADRLSNLQEAIQTRNAEKLKRYVGQTQSILKIIPRQVNSNLWDAINRLLAKET